MYPKVLLFIVLLFLANTSQGIEKKSQHVHQQSVLAEPFEAAAGHDLNSDATFWRSWKPWKLLKLGQSMFNKGLTRSRDRLESDLERRHGHRDRSRGKIKNKICFHYSVNYYCLFLVMFYIDSQCTVTRRESSLILSKRIHAEDRSEYDGLSTARGVSTAQLVSESVSSLPTKKRGSIERELVTMMFNSMLNTIVESWEPIIQQKTENSTPNDLGKTTSELTFTSKKKRSNEKGKPSKTKRSRSKTDVLDPGPVDPLFQTWFTAPNERAIIRFQNGNIYEGCISMKCMHGEGRFQWADGTVYLGQFKNNKIVGKGIIQWNDDTWYEGDFVDNVRHGRGLYVDSRRQRSYAGDWHCGTKHGRGIVYYSESFKNSYDGEWIHNVRHGFGSREYCHLSGYKGQWDKYVREGNGLMIWPNHDFYRGEWKNGVMSGYGVYIWNAYYNDTMSLPSINVFRGNWEKGQRNGYGILNLGLGYGSYYKGNFKNNMKHGIGKFVTNTGLIIQDKHLFLHDNIAMKPVNDIVLMMIEPFKFDICDNYVGLVYHIEQALKHMDKEQETRANIIMNYIGKNKAIYMNILSATNKCKIQEVQGVNKFEDLIDFEEISLRKALRCYHTELKNIYYTYATICNNEDINFRPVLIRLYLWQLYYDCNIHRKGLTLIEIDRIFHRNPEWLSKFPHNPFEKIYFWQFLHSLISVASKLYAKKQLPSIKPDTILACAFREFMDKDVLVCVNQHKGRLANGCGSFVPLKGLYALYRSLGEPHTVRTFLCAIRRPSHNTDQLQPPLVDPSDIQLPLGRNTFMFGDEMLFITESHELIDDEEIDGDHAGLKMFNFGNLSSKVIIKIFAQIFPQLYVKNKIMDLEIEISFYEFFEAFIACAEESILVKNEEMR